MSLSIKADNITVELNKKVILKDISLAIKENESIVFIGPSGSGKTVLLKALAGIYTPTKGAVYVDGVDWKDVKSDQKEKLAEKLGMLFQQGALFDEMTALENVEFPIRLHHHHTEEETHEIAKELLKKVNLYGSMDKKPGQLSGGMQRRLGIARALALNPEVVFYDDPVAGQDPVQGNTVLNLIKDFKRKNDSTLIMSTSDMKFAYKIADRIFMVIDKQVIETGSPQETKACNDPRVQQFINGELEGPISIR